MTGYGDASITIDGVHYFVEVRALNNKYFKATIRLAEALQGLEAEMEARLREKISRGTVTLTARSTDASASAAYTINTQALDRYVQQLSELPQVKGGGLKLDLGQLLNLPGVLQPPADEEDRLDKARGIFLPLLDKAVTNLLAMRQREGRVLVDDLKSHQTYIAERLSLVAQRAPGVVADYQSRLKQRIETMFREADATVEPADLIREIAVYAERTDIAEEIKRLSAHLDQFGSLISATDGKPIGRTLDFLAQEMLREANTIASKSPDAAISRSTVEIKGAIDRIKEQAANIE
ncbi:MAG TPA: YicC/YloC family endoribonuclease [Phycisphaerales bacterium]|nr:YicC/YloC family endoribonuclease [Phycisphaerales bacterium]